MKIKCLVFPCTWVHVVNCGTSGIYQCSSCKQISVGAPRVDDMGQRLEGVHLDILRKRLIDNIPDVKFASMGQIQEYRKKADEYLGEVVIYIKKYNSLPAISENCCGGTSNAQITEEKRKCEN